MSPEVSVIIPCYNSERFIRETLSSVLSQTFAAIEIIIIDDGSTDSTKEIIDSFSDLRIKYFYKQNEGVSIARNRGIGCSKGKYIAFLDADDIWLPEKIERQVGKMEKEKSASLIYSGFYIIDDNGLVMDTFNRESSGDIIKDLVLIGNTIGTSSGVLARREVFEDTGGFDPSLSTAADWDMWIRILNRYGIAYIDKPLFKYRSHASGMHRNINIQEQDTRKILHKFFSSLTQENKYRKIKRLSMSNAYMIIAKSYLEKRHIVDFLRTVAMSIFYCPFIFFNLIKDFLKRMFA